MKRVLVFGGQVHCHLFAGETLNFLKGKNKGESLCFRV